MINDEIGLTISTCCAPIASKPGKVTFVNWLPVKSAAVSKTVLLLSLAKIVEPPLVSKSCAFAKDKLVLDKPAKVLSAESVMPAFTKVSKLFAAALPEVNAVSISLKV